MVITSVYYDARTVNVRAFLKINGHRCIALSLCRNKHVNEYGFKTPERTSGLPESPRQKKTMRREPIDTFGIFSLPASIHFVLSYLHSAFQLFEVSK